MKNTASYSPLTILLEISGVALEQGWKWHQPQGSRSGQRRLAGSTWQPVYTFLRQVLPILLSQERDEDIKSQERSKPFLYDLYKSQQLTKNVNTIILQYCKYSIHYNLNTLLTILNMYTQCKIILKWFSMHLHFNRKIHMQYK